MLAYRRAPTVQPGDPITSTQYAALAGAINDRLLAGPGDPAWRIAMWWFNLFRQPRNPDSSGFRFPSQGEFFELYQHLDPDHHGGTTWPVAGPGEFEGANLANPMMQYIFGIEPNLDWEDVALDQFPLWLGAPPVTPRDHWLLGIHQRGAYNPPTGAQNVPALEAAQRVFRIVQPHFSPHGKSYGAWWAQPTILLDNCGTLNTNGLGIPSYELTFTALRPGVSTAGLSGTIGADSEGRPTVTYAGTCPCETEYHAAGHVLGVGRFAFTYYLYVSLGPDCSYTVDRLPTKDWIEGPYTGPSWLQRSDGQQLHRALWTQTASLRGTPAQRAPDSFSIQAIAVDWQEILSRQYYLSPNIAAIEGDSLVPIYPTAHAQGGATIAPGAFLPFSRTGKEDHFYAPGTVIAGIYAEAVDLSDPITIEILDAQHVIATLSLDPSNPSYPSDPANPTSPPAQQLTHWLQNSPRPAPLRIRLPLGAAFNSSNGSITVQTTEQIAYKPEFWDAWLIARLGATKGGPAQQSGVDGDGRAETEAREIGERYLTHGCIVNPHAAGVRTQAEWVNDHPAFEAARRLSQEHVRIHRRQQLVAYEVANGKSILYFKRFAFGLANTRADTWAGIAPPLDHIPPDSLRYGLQYIVQGPAGAHVTYRGASFHVGQSFTVPIYDPANPPNPSDLLYYQPHNGAIVYQVNGIIPVAPPKGFSNRWVLFLNTKSYSPFETSIWKPTAYSDYFTWSDRCHFLSGSAPTALLRHFQYNNSVELNPTTFLPQRLPIKVQQQFIAPEAPTGYRYALQANTLYASESFRKSCQVYQHPYEIESVTVLNPADLHQTVKVTLKQRLRSHPSAPATVNPDPAAWSSAERTALTDEAYRTDDNALREYVLSQADGNYECSFKIGDAGTNSGAQSLTDRPRGSCYPHIFCVHLVPEPFADGNDILQNHDSRALFDGMLQAEIYARASCEGYVDGRTSEEIICATGLGNLHDFTFENACFQAFSGRNIGVLPNLIRPDVPAGHGPLPNTIMYAEIFSRISAVWNLLDKARLDLPIAFRWRTHQYERAKPVTTTPAWGALRSWVDAASPGGQRIEIGISEWESGWALGASSSVALSVGDPAHLLRDQALDWEYQARIHPDYLDAIPTELQDLIDLGYTGFVARLDTEINTWRRNPNPATGYNCNGSYYVDGAGTRQEWLQNTAVISTHCGLYTSGILKPLPIPPADYHLGIDTPSCINVALSIADLTLLAEQGAFLQIPILP